MSARPGCRPRRRHGTRCSHTLHMLPPMDLATVDRLLREAPPVRVDPDLDADIAILADEALTSPSAPED